MTKRWDQHRAIIVSFYKQHNKPLHEVKRLMAEQYGFVASVRAYRSRFDRWGVRKYKRRRQWGSSSNGSLGGSPRTDDDVGFGAKSEEDNCALTDMTPPSSPDSDETTTALAGEHERSQHDGLQRVTVFSPHQRYFAESPDIFGSSGSGGGGGSPFVPPSPGRAESTTSGSTTSRTSSISQPLDRDYHGARYSRQSRSGTDHAIAPTEQQQYSAFDAYRQHRYQAAHPYRRQLPRSGPGPGLALPPAMDTQRGQGGRDYAWPAPLLQAPYQVAVANIGEPGETDF